MSEELFSDRKPPTGDYAWVSRKLVTACFENLKEAQEILNKAERTYIDIDRRFWWNTELYFGIVLGTTTLSIVVDFIAKPFLISWVWAILPLVILTLVGVSDWRRRVAKRRLAEFDEKTGEWPSVVDAEENEKGQPHE